MTTVNHELVAGRVDPWSGLCVYADTLTDKAPLVHNGKKKNTQPELNPNSSIDGLPAG